MTDFTHTNQTFHLIPELEAVKEYISSEEELRLIQRGYDFARDRHADKRRDTNELYLDHVVTVAQLLIEFRLDPASICAALLHELNESSATAENEIREQFGTEILNLVQGASKLPEHAFLTGDNTQSENFRKMLFASAQDLRIIFIKLADRLANMRVLKYLPFTRQQSIAKETLEIYAPLANRLGIAKIKWELEDLAFRYLEPDMYQDIRKQVTRKRREREKYIEECRTIIAEKLSEAGIKAEIIGRPKHFYSIYQKMKRQHISLDDMYDLAGVRIICFDNEEKNCYHALGIIHTLWPPIEKRFKDYIALPKSNMYQSIHSSVIGPQGFPLEIQIRTREMDRIAEVGIAAHWKYKEIDQPADKSRKQFDWLHQLVDWLQDIEDPRDFMEHFKIDLFPDEIYVFTPKGEVKFMPRGATPVDFAYLIHSDIGRKCTGAKVNGHIVPLSHQLQSGDRVEILTSAKHYPSPDWLAFTKTPQARNKIRKDLHDQHRLKSIELGKKLLNQELKKHKLTLVRFLKANQQKFEEILAKMGLREIDDLLAQIGLAKINPLHITHKLLDLDSTQAPKTSPSPADTTGTISGRTIVRKTFGLDVSIKVDGLDNMLVTFAKCCNPVPGDAIVGFITRGRGLSIHTRDCPNTLTIKGLRRVDVDWKYSRTAAFTVRIKITAKDRKGLFADTTSAITKMNSNILSGQMNVQTSGDEASGIFFLQVQDISHLDKIIAALYKVKGITKVTRIKSLK